MYQNLEYQNLGDMRGIEYDIEIQGEVMLMETADYFPEAVSAIAKLSKFDESFKCELEVCSRSRVYTAEAYCEDPCFCFDLVQQRMREKVKKIKNHH